MQGTKKKFFGGRMQILKHFKRDKLRNMDESATLSIALTMLTKFIPIGSADLGNYKIKYNWETIKTDYIWALHKRASIQ